MLLCLIDYLLQLDDRIFLLFNGIHSPFWDQFMFIITGKFIWVPTYAAIAAALFATRRWKVALVFLAVMLLTIAITDSGIAQLIRPYLSRMRPSNEANPISALAHNVNGYTGGDYGFPSCHAANSFALAMFMSLVARRRLFTWFIFIWAFVHSYTRLYLGVHYPGDLMVGGLLGVVIGWGMYALTAAALRLCGAPECRPGWHPLATAPWCWPLAVALLTIAGAAVASLC